MQVLNSSAAHHSTTPGEAGIARGTDRRVFADMTDTSFLHGKRPTTLEMGACPVFDAGWEPDTRQIKSV